MTGARARARRWRGAVVGLAAGALQGTTFVVLALLAAIEQTLAVSPGGLWGVTVAGLFVPLAAAVVLAAGDLVGGRLVMWATQGASVVGVLLLAGAGALAWGGARPWALGAVWIGALLVSAAARHGDLIVVRVTRVVGPDGRATAVLGPDEQVRVGLPLRSFQVLGIFLPPVLAGLASQLWGWAATLAGYGALLAACCVVLDRALGPERPAAGRVPARRRWRAFAIDTRRLVTDRRLVWAACGALAARAAVSCFAFGMPLLLAGQGYPSGWIGAVTSVAGLAALAVGRGATSARRLGLVAGAITVAAALQLAAAALLTREHDFLSALAGAPGAILFVGAVALASSLAEWGKQWTQHAAMVQARHGGGLADDYRRQATVHVGTSIGLIAGARLGALAASAGEQVWLGLFLALAIGAWGLQAAWSRVAREHGGLDAG